MYIEILKDIYTDSSVTVHLHKESEKIRIKRGVRQGDTISPKLFTATLESIFRRLNWENKGVKIDGEFLSNLRFADDIFLCTETPQELQQMLQELSDESKRMGLKMNIAKTIIIIIIIMAVFVLRGWLPHRGKAQMACNYCFPTRTMF